MERKLQEVHPLLTLCGQIVENWQGNPIQKESLRVFFLVLQVTHYLDAGQVRNASHRRTAGEQAGRPRHLYHCLLSLTTKCILFRAYLPHVPHHALAQALFPYRQRALRVAWPHRESSLGLTYSDGVNSQVSKGIWGVSI